MRTTMRAAKWQLRKIDARTIVLVNKMAIGKLFEWQKDVQPNQRVANITR